MGMQARIVLYADNSQLAREAADAAFAEMNRLDGVLSDWRTDSDVARVNAAAGGEPVPVDAACIEVLERSAEISQLSDGAFDVTIGPVTALWREAQHSQQPPTAQVIDRAHALVNWRNIEVNATAQTVRLIKAGMRLDFGGIGKGYAADRGLEVLRQLNCRAAMVSIAGDIRLGDAPPESRGWLIAVHDGLTHEGSPPLLLANCGISTSGDLEQSLTIDGIRHSHIIHPRQGLGLTDLIAATVIASDATTSDALATAVCVMGAERGLAMIAKIDSAAARLVTLHGETPSVQTSANFP
jgi:thiamine biosynthesis lipoprotein